MATTPPPTSGSANTSTLSEWAGPYVTDMLGKAQALSNTPYQTYQGPLTAGASDIQQSLFQGIGNMGFPGNLGKSFSSTDAYQLPQYNAAGTTTGGGKGTGIAGQYMNPYLQSVLTPQLDELRRQSQITQMGNNAKFTGAGAFGGDRQAIMDAETQRNLMQEQNKTVGQGYANAYDKAMGQFNTEQNQSKTLADLMASTGQTQRGIENEGVAADLKEFQAQRDYPQQQLQFLNSMIQGLPISTVANVPQGQTMTQQTVGNLDTVQQLLKNLGIVR
jgi:hypothetical protein